LRLILTTPALTIVLNAPTTLVAVASTTIAVTSVELIPLLLVQMMRAPRREDIAYLGGHVSTIDITLARY
jgi:hypothetical protein